MSKENDLARIFHPIIEYRFIFLSDISISSEFGT